MLQHCTAVQGMRQKRLIFNFEDAATEDVAQRGCDAGYITNTDSTCVKCHAGTFANTG